MEEQGEITTMLQLLPQPAFRVENGVITHINPAAAAYFLQPGQPFAPMIVCGAQEYAEFSAGSLYLTLSLCDQHIGAVVSSVEPAHIVTLVQAAGQPQLQAMALAAKELREPLGGMLSLAEQMLPAIIAENGELETQAAQMNRRLYQMLRIVSNMSDAVTYVQPQPGRMETVEICAFLAEILDKTGALAQQAHISLVYELPGELIFTLADREKLERAIYNLLSNAIKYALRDTAVSIKLVRKDKRLYLSVSNASTGPVQLGNLYNRFLREPALEDSRNGIGLGMALVCSVATQHGGTVLVDTADDSTRVTMTMQIKQAPAGSVHSPVMRFDYAGERDHCLIELADVLPASAYSPDQVN